MARFRFRALSVLATLVFNFGPTEQSHAYCSEPSFFQSAPDAPGSYSKPDVPYCLSSYSNSRTHTCDDWQINSYLDEVREYVRKLRDYADEANNFANAAILFANEAVNYAKCEAEDVNSQHE